MANAVRGTPFEELERDGRHMKDLASALRSLKDRLAEEGIPFAVIGALAVRHHGHARFTEDIDILTTKEGLLKIHARSGGRGSNPRSPGLRKKLRMSEYQVDLDVITSAEQAGGTGSPISFPDPMSDSCIAVEGLRYPTLEKLIELKLASHIWGDRTQDLADAIRLIQLNQLDQSFKDRLHPAVQAKFVEAIDAAARERELE